MNAVRAALVGPGKEITTATTGKAATLLGGSTIYSVKGGLALPVGKAKMVPLNGRILSDLQKNGRMLKSYSLTNILCFLKSISTTSMHDYSR